MDSSSAARGEVENGAGYLRILGKKKEIKWSHTQVRQVLLQQFNARWGFLSVNALLLVLTLYTSIRFPHKFVRVNGECASNWLNLSATQHEHEIICCDHTNTDQAPCYYGMGLAGVFEKLEASWLVPLTPLIINYVCVMLGPNTSMARIRPLVRRGLLYGAVMFVRTGVLYLGFNAFEKRVMEWWFGASEEPECWYSHMRRSGKCAAHFDHADHLVLFISHFLAVTLFEWFALSVEIPAPWYTSLKKACLEMWMLTLGLLATYMLTHSAMYFHTPMENLVAVTLSQVVTMVPLYFLSQDWFSKVKFLQLKHFVRPKPDPRRD